MRKLFVFIALLIITIPIVLAQDCTGFHKYHCLYADYSFYYSKQSKSTLMSHGQTTSLNIVAYGGEEYYVGLCAHRKFGDLKMRILEDSEEKTVIYDNAQDDFAQNVTFINEKTRNLIIEVSVPEDKSDENNRRCVGILIEYKDLDKE